MNKLEYKILLKSNFLTAQTGIIGKNIDITYKRNSNGDPIINAKLIKGVIKEKFIQFSKTLNEYSKGRIERIFGGEGKNISKIFFGNLSLKKEKKVNTRHSIKVDRKTKTTIEGSLFNYEFLERNQEFLGEIQFKDELSKEDLKLFLASIFHVDKLGGFKSRGLGNVEILIKYQNDYVGIEKIDEILKTIKINKEVLAVDDFVKYKCEFEFLTPIVLQENKINNIITARTNLQGSTIRGALINLGLEKGIDINILRNIEVKLVNKEIHLKSEFVTKYKLSNGEKMYIDKTIISNEDKLLNMEFGNKFERSNIIDFKTKVDEISIKIDNDKRVAEDKMLFNHEVIENIGNLYEAEIYIPKNLIIENVSDVIYIGKYKSKGFGKIKIKLSSIKENKKNSLEERINNFNRKINEDKKYITFDFLSDCILPLNRINNILDDFKKIINIELENEVDKTFVGIEKLRGYNIVNNVKKSDELIITKGSVLTYSCKDVNSIMDILKKIEEKGIGLRLKEGFGIVNICTDTYVRNKVIK